MCGILCCFELLNQQNASSDSLPEPKDKGFGETFSFLKNETVNRGPDYVSPVLDYSFKIDTKEDSPSVQACFLSTVLSLRVPFTKQPVIENINDLNPNQKIPCGGCGKAGSLLIQFNGELYNDEIQGNDTVYFANSIKKSLNTSHVTKDDRVRNISKFMSSLKGEYAFVVTDMQRKEVWFARDAIGRRSLVIHRRKNPSESIQESDKLPSDTVDMSEENEDAETMVEGDIGSGIVISSVSGGQLSFGKDGLSTEDDFETVEVPANKLFRMDLNTSTIESFSWEFPQDSSEGSLIYPYTLINRKRLSESLQPIQTDKLLKKYDAYTNELDNILTQATRRRLKDIPSITHKKPILDKYIKDSSFAAKGTSAILSDSLPLARVAVLFSGGIDCSLVAHYIAKILKEDEKTSNEPIDLLNVAFENPRKAKTRQNQEKIKTAAKKKKKNDKKCTSTTSESNNVDSKQVQISSPFDIDEQYETPDRSLGRKSWESLSEKYPNLRFIEINIPYQETLAHKQRVCDLMCPRNSVMDLSIAIAFYFASRGEGTLYFKNTLTKSIEKISGYSTTANVLFSGLGADELFGGYMRHARIIENGIKDLEKADLVDNKYSFDELAHELQMDFSRLHYRNLGRDDRVCSSWARELRYVFLDEDVVNWAMSTCPLDLKINASKPENSLVNKNDGIADQLSTSQISNENGTTKHKPPKKKGPKPDIVITKFVLRRIAHKYGSSSGLAVVENEKKRAIQFGARSAKMDIGSGRSKGTDKL